MHEVFNVGTGKLHVKNHTEKWVMKEIFGVFVLFYFSLLFFEFL